MKYNTSSANTSNADSYLKFSLFPDKTVQIRKALMELRNATHLMHVLVANSFTTHAISTLEKFGVLLGKVYGIMT